MSKSIKLKQEVKHKMDKSITLLATLLVIASLLLGAVFSYAAFPREVTKEVVKEVTIEKPVEVIKEIEVIKEVTAPSILDKAVDTFLVAVENEEDEDGNDVDALNEYDFDQISVSKIDKDYSVIVSEKGDKTEVYFTIKLKYDELTDDEKSEKETFNVKITYEDDEDSKVEILY